MEFRPTSPILTVQALTNHDHPRLKDRYRKTLLRNHIRRTDHVLRDRLLCLRRVVSCNSLQSHSDRRSHNTYRSLDYRPQHKIRLHFLKSGPSLMQNRRFRSRLRRSRRSTP